MSPTPDPLAVQQAFADLESQALAFAAEARGTVDRLIEQGWSAESADRIAAEHAVLLVRLFANGVVAAQRPSGGSIGG